MNEDVVVLAREGQELGHDNSSPLVLFQKKKKKDKKKKKKKKWASELFLGVKTHKFSSLWKKLSS